MVMNRTIFIDFFLQMTYKYATKIASLRRRASCISTYILLCLALLQFVLLRLKYYKTVLQNRRNCSKYFPVNFNSLLYLLYKEKYAHLNSTSLYGCMSVVITYEATTDFP